MIIEVGKKFLDIVFYEVITVLEVTTEAVKYEVESDDKVSTEVNSIEEFIEEISDGSYIAAN